MRGTTTLLQPLVAFHFVQMPPYKFYFVEKLITTLQVLDLMKVVYALVPLHNFMEIL